MINRIDNIDRIIDPSRVNRELPGESRVDFAPPDPTGWVEKALNSMGYTDAEQANPVVHEKTLGFSNLINEQAAPVFLFKSRPLETCSAAGFSTERFTINSARWGKIATLMKGAKEICCFGLTLGERVETMNRELDKKSLIDSFVWDVLCSTLAEHYADRAELFLARYYRMKGLEITRRFSPGYCDLSLEEGQRAVFGFCGFDAIGMTLSPFGLMNPRKSITGMVLAAECVSLRAPCRFCKRECGYRRK
jgi:hypothetical protein